MYDGLHLQRTSRLSGDNLGESRRALSLCRVERGMFREGRLPADDDWLYVRHGDVLGEAEAKAKVS